MAAATAPPPAYCNSENGCVVFDCLAHLWEWIDPPLPDTDFPMDNKKAAAVSNQQTLSAHTSSSVCSQQPAPAQNGLMQHLLHSHYQRHDTYGSSGAQNYTYQYPQSPPENHEVQIPKGYNAEVYQDYMKRNPPTSQIYQNQYRPEQYASKPYLPYSNRTGPQSNTELLKRQYNEIQQMKLQQQMHYQNQAQMHQQQKFAERQILLQHLHGVQPPPNLQNSLYGELQYSADIQKDVDRYAKNNDYKEMDKLSKCQEPQWQPTAHTDFREADRYRRLEADKSQSPPSEPKSNMASPVKSVDSSSPSAKSPLCLRSPVAQRQPTAPVALAGLLHKQGSDGLKVWRKRWFVLAEYCLFYYKSQDEEKLLGSVLLPSYRVSACSPEDKVLRKHAFKLEHANMRTYVLAAASHENMMQWIRALAAAAVMKSPIEPPQKYGEQSTAKLEEDEVPGPTYANAPPKPRRSNEGYNSPSPEMYDPNYDLVKKPPSHYSQSAPQRYEQNYASSQYSRTQHKRPYDSQHLSLPLNTTEQQNQPRSNFNFDRQRTQPPPLEPKQEIYERHSLNPFLQDINTPIETPKDSDRESQNIPHSQSSIPQSQMNVPQMNRTLDQINLPQTQISRALEQMNAHQSQINIPQMSRTMDMNTPQNQINIPQMSRAMDMNTPQNQINIPQMSRAMDMNTPQNQINIPQMSRAMDMNTPQNQINTPQMSKAMDMNTPHNQINIPQMSRTMDMNTPQNQINIPQMNRSLEQDPYDSVPKAESNSYNRDVYGDVNTRAPRCMTERRTPDAYGRASSMMTSSQGKADYEDVYAPYTTNEYGDNYYKSSNPFQPRDAISVSSQQPLQDYAPAQYQEKPFSGPSVLRRKKMQASGIQPAVLRPHSADFLEYEAKQEMLNKTAPNKAVSPRQPQRPKSSLDINSYYDPSSDRYYSEESYAEKMRQSAQYLHPGMAPRNIQIPLAKYASGLAEKQLNSPYPQTVHNYEMEFGKTRPTPTAKFDEEGLHSNWTLKEKALESQKELLRSGSMTSDGSHKSGAVKERAEATDTFLRSASARLPATVNANEKQGEKKVQQREESMKRLLEWKQRMLQSPLTRKSTPATISLARSLNHSRQSVRSSEQYKQKYGTSYNSYSSDDEEETTGTDLQKPSEVQAGRSQRLSVTSDSISRPMSSHAPCTPLLDHALVDKNVAQTTDNTYENIHCTDNIATEQTDEAKDIGNEPENADETNKATTEDDQDGYETQDSEAESEGQMEYTDNDLDEVLLESDAEVQNTEPTEPQEVREPDVKTEHNENIPDTPPILSSAEDHYLPMSPRKTSTIEPAHKTILQNLSVFNQSAPHGYEDNPYVEMNVGNEEEDMQTYEIVCVNNGKVEPVYMELSNFAAANQIDSEDGSVSSSSKFLIDTASNFADTKDLTLKRSSKGDKITKERSDCSDADDEASKDISLDAPFSRFSISDNFRPASYYLGASLKSSEAIDSSDSEILPPSAKTSSCNELSGEALSKYILDKIDSSDMSQDNSILKMLTSENQKMNTVKRKTTSLMIYGSRTSIHDTLSRGEKIRNSRASLTNEKKINESPVNLVGTSILEHYNSSSIESDSLRSYNADRGSSRLSSESDISSKFEMAPSNISSEVTSLNESEVVDFRYPKSFEDLEVMMKRRPVSDDSIFELSALSLPTEKEPNDASNSATNSELDRFLGNLQPGTSTGHLHPNATGQSHQDMSMRCSLTDTQIFKDNTMQAAQFHTVSHTRSSSTPVSHCTAKGNRNDRHIRKIDDPISGYVGSQSSCSSGGLAKSPISYYCKDYDEEKILSKNLKSDILADKIKEFDCEKIAPKSGMETNTSSTTTGFHSRESSTEHSAPYYYSDLSSQEHINLMPTSHYLKNTNLHRKLNNQRRRGPFHKKTDISHIHNPIRNSDMLIGDTFDLATSARSVSVEFLSAADKDPEIDIKNIYASSGGRNSKIPESMSLLTGLGCKRNSSNFESSSPDSNATNRSGMNTSSAMKISNASMSSHCSGNSSNTVYYDAEAEASETRAYENVMCQGEKHWDEDSLWRDNLRRVSHRHARSMDDLDTVQSEMPLSPRPSVDICGMNSIKRIKKHLPNKLTRNVTYVNCAIQNEVLRRIESNSKQLQDKFVEDSKDENDVYVSLAEDAGICVEHSDEGVYEQLVVGSSTMQVDTTDSVQRRNKRRFEIDREKLRQWDLMSSGLMKGVSMRGGAGGRRGAGAGRATTTATTEASTTMAGTNVDLGTNNSVNEQALIKKAFLGSNTSIGRTTRDVNIPVRAVSPRVRWVEDKPQDHYGSQLINTSQQNFQMNNGAEESRATGRSPSRAQQPVRAVSPRVRRHAEQDDLRVESVAGTAGELLGRTHEELVLLLIQLRRRHAATQRAMRHTTAQIHTLQESLNSLKALEREESLQRFEQLKLQLAELESQYAKSKPLVQLVDSMVKLGSLYNRPGSTVERLERNQRLRHQVLQEHAVEQRRWLESAAAGRPLETEAARARVAELWALEQELADEAGILQGLRTDKDALETLLTGVRSKLPPPEASPLSPGLPPALTPPALPPAPAGSLEAELARVHAMLAHNSKKLEQTVADNARLERELQQLRRALQARRTATQPHATHPTALLEDEVSRVQHLVSQLQRQRQELSRAVRHLTQQSHALQLTHDNMPDKRRPTTSWQETNLDTGHTTDHNYEYSGHYQPTNVETPLYVDTRTGADASPLNSDDLHNAFGNLSTVEKQEIKTVRIVKRESERRQRDRDRDRVLLPSTDWPLQYADEQVSPSTTFTRGATLPRADYSRFEEYYAKQQENYLRSTEKPATDLSPKFPSSPSLSNYDSLSFSRNEPSVSERTLSASTHYLNSPNGSATTLTNDMSKTSSIMSLSRSNMELSPIFKSEAAKQIITEMSNDTPKTGSLHRRLVPKEKRRHNTAPHHLSAKVLNEMPKDYNQDKMGRSVDDADMLRALRTAPAPDVVSSALPARYADSIDQLLAAPQKILIPERYIPEKPPELSPEEKQKRQEKVESIKKMLSGTPADSSTKSPDGEEKRQREHLLQMNQILAKQVTEMSKIIAVKALEQLPEQNGHVDLDDRSPDVELPIYQQRDNFFT